MQFIDTHQHLIWRDRFGYSWTRDIPALAKRDFSPADYDQETAGARIVGKIFMEVGVDDADYQAEARHVAGLIGQHGLLGQIASVRPESDAGFDDWLDECRGLHVVGFRRILHVVPDHLSQSDTFRRNLGKIGAVGLPFDLNFLARQLLPIGVPLLRACPDQVFVLDHCGVPDIAAAEFSGWAAGISAIAQFPQVVCKLSGIAAYCAPGTAGIQRLKPYFDHVLNVFGPDRMMWGSDWPVVNLGLSLSEWITTTRGLLAGLTVHEQTAIAEGTARRIYHLAAA